jgi:hypothetical protein
MAEDTAYREKPLSETAKRALAEAEQRRRAAGGNNPAAEEKGGRGGLDPARYGDWEIKGIACDF